MSSQGSRHSRDRGNEDTSAPWAVNDFAASSTGSPSVTRSPSAREASVKAASSTPTRARLTSPRRHATTRSVPPPPPSLSATPDGAVRADVSPSPSSRAVPLPLASAVPLPLSYALAHSPSVERRPQPPSTRSSHQRSPSQPSQIDTSRSVVDDEPRVESHTRPSQSSPEEEEVHTARASLLVRQEEQPDAQQQQQPQQHNEEADTPAGPAPPVMSSSSSSGETAVAITAAATRAAAELIQRLVESWVPCSNADLPPRYRNAAGYYCDYCTYAVCESCFTQIPSALLDPVGPTAATAAAKASAVASPAPETLESALLVMAQELLTGHTRSHLAPSTITSLPTAARPVTAGPTPCFRCHLCKRGALVHEAALLHEWSCEGPMPESRVRRRNSVVYDTDILQRYHFMKEQRQLREQTYQRLSAHFHGYHAPSPSPYSAAPLRRLPGRPPRCEEGGTFVFSVDNPRLAESCVWCAVNYEPREVAARFKGSMTVTPVLPWMCPPSLPGVPPRRYRVSVPEGSYAFGNTHALALFVTSDIFRKATAQLTMVSPSAVAGGGGGGGTPSRHASGALMVGSPSPTPSKKQSRHSRRRQQQAQNTSKTPSRAAPGAAGGAGAASAVLGTTLVMPATAIEALLTVHIVHHIATQPQPPLAVLAWGGKSHAIVSTSRPHQSSPWTLITLAEADDEGEEHCGCDKDKAVLQLAGSTPTSITSPSSRKRPRTAMAESPDGSSKKQRGEQHHQQQQASSFVEQDQGLCWPPGLDSDELRLCVDHIVQGRSVAVYGLGSKRFFLQHVSQSASLKDFTVVTVDGSVSARLQRNARGSHQGPVTSTTTARATTSTATGASLATRRLREATRYLATRLPVARVGRGSAGGAKGAQAHAQRVLDALVSLAGAADAAPEDGKRITSDWTTGGEAQPQQQQQRVPGERSRSLPRDTTLATLASAASDAHGSTAQRTTSRIVDVVDVDDEELAQQEGGAADVSGHALVPSTPAEVLHTPHRQLSSQAATDHSARFLPPPTQLRTHNTQRDGGDDDEDGVESMVMDLAKALSTPTPTPYRSAQAPPSSTTAFSQQRPPPLPPQVELGADVALSSPAPLQQSLTRTAEMVVRATANTTATMTTADPIPVMPVQGAQAKKSARHGESEPTQSPIAHVGFTLAEAASRCPSVSPIEASTLEAMQAAASSFTLDAPLLVRPSSEGRPVPCGAVQRCGPASVRFARSTDRIRYLRRARRLVGGHCTRWHSLPSATALAMVHDAEAAPAAARAVTLDAMRQGQRQSALPPPMLLVVHHVDLLDAEAEAWLLQLCSRFSFPRPHVRLLVSFDKPQWPLSGLATALQSMSLVLLQLRSLVLPRVQEVPEVTALDLLTSFESAAGGGGGGGGSGGPSNSHSGGGGQHLPLQDTMRRILFSLPATFAELLHILLTAQEEHGEGQYISLFTLGAYFEKNGLLVSHGRMKALQRELTSNRLAVYDAAEHALVIPQHRKLAAVLEEVTTQRRAGGEQRGFADTTS